MPKAQMLEAIQHVNNSISCQVLLQILYIKHVCELQEEGLSVFWLESQGLHIRVQQDWPWGKYVVGIFAFEKTQQNCSLIFTGIQH